MNKEIPRGAIFYADLNPVIGSEQGGIRPVLVLQNDTGNIHSETVIIAAITSRKKKRLPTHAPIYIPQLKRYSIVLLEQLRTIDKKRLEDFIGVLGKEQMKKVDRALAVSIGLTRGIYARENKNADD